MVKQHLETVLYKPVCCRRFKVWCARTYPHSYDMLRMRNARCIVYRVERSCWPSLCHCSPPSLDPGCSTLCSNCHNCFLASHVILHDFLYVQCIVHGSRAFGWFNPLSLKPVKTSPHSTIWLRKVGLLSNQSELWVDATCSLKIEHLGCAENQALANYRCSQITFCFMHWSNTQYSLLYSIRSFTPGITVFWALWVRLSIQYVMPMRFCILAPLWSWMKVLVTDTGINL